MGKKKKPVIACYECKKTFRGEDAVVAHAQDKRPRHQWRAPTSTATASPPSLQSLPSISVARVFATTMGVVPSVSQGNVEEHPRSTSTIESNPVCSVCKRWFQDETAFEEVPLCTTE